ncbi:MAG: hypothetical protein O3A00_08195 [Planctomycetota bacterium]|nr:hypothetical protein [Planctomycetota bacterium]
MSVLPSIDKVAIFLYSLAPHVSGIVLDMLGEPHASQIRSLIQRYKRDPELMSYVEEVVREFQLMAGGSINLPISLFDINDPEILAAVQAALSSAESGGLAASGMMGSSKDAIRAALAGEGLDDDAWARSADGDLDLGEDPVAFLRSLDLPELQAALRHEHPNAVAIVLNTLETQQASRLLRRMPSEIRRKMFVLMAAGIDENSDLSRRVVRTIVDIAKELKMEPMEAESENRFRRLADILQMMTAGDRESIMDSLKKRDESIAEQVDEYLFEFTDIQRIDDRSLQRLLVEVDQKELATALFNAPPEITTKVMNNLSERAHTVVKEEISYLGAVPPLRVEEAKRNITETIRLFEKAGRLVWTR